MKKVWRKKTTPRGDEGEDWEREPETEDWPDEEGEEEKRGGGEHWVEPEGDYESEEEQKRVAGGSRYLSVVRGGWNLPLLRP